MLEAALSTSPVVTRLLVGALFLRPQKHVSRAPPCRRNVLARALCITISHDRGDESFADDLNMGRGIVSGRVALLLRSTEIPPHRPNDLLPLPNTLRIPSSPRRDPGVGPRILQTQTWEKLRQGKGPVDRATSTQEWARQGLFTGDAGLSSPAGGTI
jgi:hypothetical protein